MPTACENIFRTDFLFGEIGKSSTCSEISAERMVPREQELGGAETFIVAAPMLSSLWQQICFGFGRENCRGARTESLRLPTRSLFDKA